jgi:hypothetical protein
MIRSGRRGGAVLVFDSGPGPAGALPPSEPRFGRALGRFRLVMLIISVLAVLNSIIEMGSLRHLHPLPLVFVAVLGVSLPLVAFSAPPRALLAARVLAMAVLGVTGCIVTAHLLGATPGPHAFNRHLTEYLTNLYPFIGLWDDDTPSWIVPGLLGESALLLLLATVGLDGRRRDRPGPHTG